MQYQGNRVFNVESKYIDTPQNPEFVTIWRNKLDGKYYGRKSDGTDEPINTIGPSDKNFVFNQLVPSQEWVVVHNLGKKCSVTIVNDLNEQMYAKVVYDNDNQVSIYFNKLKTGSVFCN